MAVMVGLFISRTVLRILQRFRQYAKFGADLVSKVTSSKNKVSPFFCATLYISYQPLFKRHCGYTEQAGLENKTS